MTPLVSIVIPAFNSAPYLDAAIRSVREQTYSNLELIVVDDGSTDDTPAILERYGTPVRCIRQVNAGQSAALNAGWRAAGGDLLGYLAADDLLRPNAVTELVKFMQARPDIVAVYPDFGMIDASSRQLRSIRAPDYSQKRLIAGVFCLPGPGALFRRSAWQVAGDWTTRLRQVPDLDFFFRLALVGPFARLPAELAVFRRHGHSATHGGIAKDRAEEPIVMVENFFTRPDLPPHVAAWRRSSQANAMMLCALMHGMAGRHRDAFLCFGRAIVTQPSTFASARAPALAAALLRRLITHIAHPSRND